MLLIPLYRTTNAQQTHSKLTTNAQQMHNSRTSIPDDTLTYWHTETNIRWCDGMAWIPREETTFEINMKATKLVLTRSKCFCCLRVHIDEDD